MDKNVEKAFILGNEKLRKLLTGTCCPSEFGLKNFCPEDMDEINKMCCTDCWIRALAEMYVDDTEETIDEWRRYNKIGFLDNSVAHEEKYGKR